MRWTIRAKLAGIVTVSALALGGLTVASSAISARVRGEVERVREHYVPLVALGPALERGLGELAHTYQDAVASMDAEHLQKAQEEKEALLAVIDGAGDAITPARAAAVKAAIERYHTAAMDVSRRLIAEETGEAIVGAIGTMQALQAEAEHQADEATAVDRKELGAIFGRIASRQRQAEELRLYVSAACILLMLLLSTWIGHGVVRSLGALGEGFRRFGSGHLDVPIAVGGDDELTDLGRQANEMARRLGVLSDERERVAWIDATHGELVRELRGDVPAAEAARRALRYLVKALGAPAGAVYLADDGSLRPVASVARGNEHALDEPPTFAPGEGLLGEAALRDDIHVIADPPAGYLRLRSGLGEAEPRAIVLVPLCRAGRLVGVVELASFQAPSERDLDLLRAVQETLAISLDVARANEDVRRLLEETQAQALRLSTQDEELRATNEELQQQHEELRQTNDELLHQAAELEEQRLALEERNERLDDARRQLEQRTRELQTVSSYKSQFLTNMSHELRTPLNSMLLLSNLLAENEERTLTDKQVEYCRTIHAAGTDLRDLINQVLDLAKVESGKQELRAEPVALRDVLDRARRVFEPLAREKQLVLEIEEEAGLPVIRTDRQRVDQILTNLLGNAVKFTARGRVRLRAHRPPPDFVLPGASEEGAVALSVSDTGPGIPPGDLERVFAPFEQLDKEADRRYGGTGVGLALSRELATLLGGELRVESTVGQGTTFTCILPVRHDRGDAAPPQSPGSPGPPPTSPPPLPVASPTAPSRAKGREVADDRASLAPDEPYLLLVEDDRIFAETFAEVIHSHGLKVALATTGRDGLRQARLRRPAGIILDVRLPDVDGFAVLKELRADPKTSEVPVHFVSAADVPDRGLALGATGYLVKPASRRDLVQVIESLVPQLAQGASRVLVVEDDAAEGRTLMKLMEGEKLDARRVASAGDALELLRSERFGCLVLDLSLPDMDGLELLRAIEEQRGAAMPAVVIYTARPLSKQETKRLEAYTEAIVLKEGASSERVLNEVRLFVRRLHEGLGARRPGPPRHAPANVRLDDRRILVVDDDMRTVYALSAALRAKGAEVLVADNGRAALEALDEAPDVDAVLMDIMMPEMDGYEAMGAIRAQERFERLPIVALTAKAMKGDAERCIEAGATDYLPKPVDVDRLLWVLHGRLSPEAPHA